MGALRVLLAVTGALVVESAVCGLTVGRAELTNQRRHLRRVQRKQRREHLLTGLQHTQTSHRTCYTGSYPLHIGVFVG